MTTRKQNRRKERVRYDDMDDSSDTEEQVIEE